MGLFGRISDIITANLSEMVEQAETEALAELRGRVYASGKSVDTALAAMKARQKTSL